MNQKLSLIGSIRGGLVFMSRRVLLSALFFLLAYGAVYYAQKLSISTDLPVMFAYLVYTYFFYYFFVCFYFRRQPLFSRRRFGNALVRMLAILLLAFAALLALKIGFKILFFLAGTLKAFPEFYERLRLAYLGLLVSPYFAWFLPIFMFIILSFTFFIPAFAWISAVIGGDSSITMTFVRTKGNYVRLIVIFLLIYGILPLTILVFRGYSAGVVAAVSALMSLIQIVIYLKVYEHFYPQK